MTENNNKMLGEIIKDVIKEKGLSQVKIAGKMNVSRQVINQIDKRKNFDYQFLKDLEKATDIDFTQYLTEPTYIRGNDKLPMNLDLNGKPDKPKGGIAYYDIEATAGLMNVFNDLHESPTYYMVIPAFADCDFALNVSGQSMEPRYKSGDLIICKKLNNLNVIPLSEAYLIITDEQRLLKIIKKGPDDKCFTLYSENPDYEPWVIQKEEIKMLYAVKGKLERQIL